MSKVDHHRAVAELFDAFVGKAETVVGEGDNEPRQTFRESAQAVHQAISAYRHAIEDGGGKGRAVAERQEIVVSRLNTLMAIAHAAGANGELPHEFKPYMVGQLGSLVSPVNRSRTTPSGGADLAEQFKLRAQQRNRR